MKEDAGRHVDVELLVRISEPPNPEKVLFRSSVRDRNDPLAEPIWTSVSAPHFGWCSIELARSWMLKYEWHCTVVNGRAQHCLGPPIGTVSVRRRGALK